MKQEVRFHTASPGAQFIDNGQLFMVAVSAAQEITAPDREGGEPKAWISIGFSVIALESFMNETIDFTSRASEGGEKNPTVRLFAQVMGVLEARRASLEEKF